MFPCTHYNDIIVIHGKLFWYKNVREQANEKAKQNKLF